MTHPHCSECDTELSGSLNTCPGCGVPLDEPPSAESRPVRRSLVRAALLVAFVLAIPIAAWIELGLTRPQVHSSDCGGRVMSDLVALEAAVQRCAIDHAGRYPESLEVLVTPDIEGATYLDRRSVPRDPWDNPYLYQPPSTESRQPRIYTLGSDGRPGGTGEAMDVDNWAVRRRYTRGR